VSAWTVVLVLLVATVAPAGAQMSPSDSGLASEILLQLNNERAARGVAPLVPDSAIAADAVDWAAYMASSAEFLHSGDPRAEIIAMGYRSGQITEAWMLSGDHRNLVVDPNLGYAGVGVICDAAGAMWAVVQFRRIDTRLGTQSTSAQSPIVTPDSQGSACGEAGSATGSSIERLYSAFFLRSADPSGLTYWTQRAGSGFSLSDISGSFAVSAEFQQRYGKLGDRKFVRLVYQNVMGRNPDQGGLNYWSSQLRAGVTRGDMMIQFSESAEYRVRSGIS